MDAPSGPVVVWPAMSAAPPVVLLLDDADTFRAVEGTCLRRDRCRLLKASFDEIPEVASKHHPDLILASCSDAAGRERALALCSDRGLADVPVLLLDFAAPASPAGGAGKAPRARRAPVEVLPARRRRSGGPDFPELDARLDAVVTKLVPQLLHRVDRLPVNLAVSCRGAGLRSQLHTKDISPSGIFLKTDRPLTPGSRFGVSVKLGAQEEVMGTCEVVRQVRAGDPDLIPGIGVRFIDLEDSGRELLRRFVSAGARGARRTPRGTTRGTH
jgi:uncharacterized protein (TIGR02266 family)